MSTLGMLRDDEFYRQMKDYWRQVKKSDGFDIEDIVVPPGIAGLVHFDCQVPYATGYPYDPLVKRYGMVGVHRYNLLKGTNFRFCCLIKLSMTMSCVNSFYITLVARDKELIQFFQVKVEEKRYGLLDVICPIARVKGETTSEPFIPSPVDNVLPDWPSHDDVFNDRERFYLVEESELLHIDWIRMYLELAVYTNDRMILEEDLFKLKIVKVAIETTDEEAPLNAKNAVVYIAFTGFASGGIGSHVVRKAIIKRVLDERTGLFSLKGNLCKGDDDLPLRSWEEIIKQNLVAELASDLSTSD